MKNISTTTIVISAVIFSLVLIIGGNVMSDNSVVSAPNSPIGHSSSVVVNSHNVEDNSVKDEILYALDFTLKNLTGETVQLSSYRGKKPVVLDFFATWCHNCQRDMPRLSNMYDKYKDDVEVIGVNLRENQRKVESFVDSYGVTFPIVMDPRGATANSYGVRYTNFHVLIDKEGRLVRTVPGDISENEIMSLLPN